MGRFRPSRSAAKPINFAKPSRPAFLRKREFVTLRKASRSIGLEPSDVRAFGGLAEAAIGRLAISEMQSMRMLIALIVVVYLIGVGVALSPTIQAKWSSASASDLATSVGQALPNAVAWPARAYRSMTDRG